MFFGFLKKKARKLAQSLNSRQFKNLTFQQAHLIGDKAYFTKTKFITSEKKKNAMKAIDRKRKMSLFEAFDDDIDDQAKKLNFLQIINQKYSELKNHFLNSKFYQQLIIFDKKIPLISPTSQLKLIWDILMLIMISYLIFIITIHVSFLKPMGDFISYEVYRVTYIMFFLNVIIRLNTSFVEKGNLINDRNKIFK